MAKFIVIKREVWTSGTEVEADNEDQALEFVREGGGTEVDGLLEFSHTLGSDTWTVVEYIRELDNDKTRGEI